jgi:hypothetical protein
MSIKTPPEFNQSVSDADIDLGNLAEKRPADCLQRVAAIFNWWCLSGCNGCEHKTLRKLASKHARRALKILEERGDR